MGTYSFNDTGSTAPSVRFVTVQQTGLYDIVSYGAQGGNRAGQTGGYGAETGGLVQLTAGEHLEIIVGGKGSDAQTILNPGDGGGGGGGGGTFVLGRGTGNGSGNGSYTLLLAAGGGGGAGQTGGGRGGYGANGTGSGAGGGGSAGQGVGGNGGGGAGFSGSGGTSANLVSGNGATSYAGAGGSGAGGGGNGGFGGGGGGAGNIAAIHNTYGGSGGGGGGFTGGKGGNGGSDATPPSAATSGGYGGRSYLISSGTLIAAQSPSTAAHQSDGLVTIQPALTLALAKDTGSSSTDGITRDDTVTGTAQVSGTITFTDGNHRTLGSVDATAGQVFTFDPAAPGNTDIAQGAGTITATEVVGSGSATASVALTYDTVLPTVAITVPIAGDNTVNAAEARQSIAISGTTTAEDGQVVTVQIRNAGGTAVDTYTNAASGGAYSVEITPTQAQALANGSYTVTANVSDKAGNPAQEATQAITVDEIAPAAPTVALNDDTGVSPTDRVTSDPTLTITPAESGGRLLYSIDGGAYGTAAPAFATDGSVDGQHMVSAEQQDAAGNVSAPGSLTFTLDTTAPDITDVTETGDGIGPNGDGDVPAGTVVTFTVQTDGPVYVTPAADGSTPTLGFNNGGVATYTGQTGTAVNQLTFSYTVQKGQDTTRLELADITGADDVTDQAGNAIDLGSLATASLPTGTLVVDTTPPVASSVTDTVAQNAGPTPIGLAAPSDNLSAPGSLAIVAGALPGDGTVTLADGRTAVATGEVLTADQLTGLEFTPTGTSGQSSAFTYTVTDGAGNASQGTATLNVGAPGTPPTTTPTPTPVAPDAVSFSPQVRYSHGVFTLTGTASSAAGVSSVEISAVVDGGAREDLGSATLGVGGTFVFQDTIGAHVQGFLTATETDRAGGTASAMADYALTGGLDEAGGYKARQTRYTADGDAETAVDLFKANGAQKAHLSAPGQTFASAFFDTFANHGAPESTFVFNPGFGRDVVSPFRVDGADHDTLSFKGADFGDDVATVLANAHDVKGGLLITDPTPSSPGGGSGTHDTLLLKGITKALLAANPGDIAFHA